MSKINKNSIPTKELKEIETQILEIIYMNEDLTTSELQGAIQAQVMEAYLIGRDGVDEDL